MGKITCIQGKSSLDEIDMISLGNALIFNVFTEGYVAGKVN